MDLAGMLAQLHAELDKLDVAIASLQRLQQADLRRGRTRQWLPKPGNRTARGPAKTRMASSHAGDPPPPEGSFET
jgi:hypothetical protein